MKKSDKKIEPQVLISRSQLLDKMREASADVITKMIMESQPPAEIMMLLPIIAVEISVTTLESIFGKEED